MKKYIILTITVILMIVLATSFICETQAVGLGEIKNLEDYIQESGDTDTGGLVNKGNIIVKVIRTFGQAISVVILAIIGIRYILGSVEEKAEYKQTMWVYIVGAVLLFSGATVTQIIYNMFQ